MPVYLDNPQNPLGRMKMCHMIADSPEELSDMADRLDLNPAWLQYGGTYREHYDISLGKRNLAIRLGAIEITTRELVMRQRVNKTVRIMDRAKPVNR